MNYTINQMETKLIVNDKELIGYAFIDSLGHCIIIVWGEANKIQMIKNLTK